MSTQPNTGASADVTLQAQAVGAGENEFKPTLGWFSATAIVAGSMIGSGIFLVSADIARYVGNAGLLIAIWVFTGIVTVLGATSYAKLAAHMPKAGGQYVFLKESWGEIPAFLYGWALLAVIQTGVLAAVAVAFAKYTGVLIPAISSEPLLLGLSTQKILALVVLFGLTWYNCRGIEYGAILQNVFTSLKILALILLIAIGLAYGQNLWNGTHDWSLSLPANHDVQGSLITLFAFATVGALFSSDTWNNVTFVASEVKEPQKNLPIALTWGTSVVVILYLVANFAYLNLMSIPQMQTAAEDRVASVAMEGIFPGSGAAIMAAIILISTFGCLNGMLLSGARVFYAMAKDGLLFRQFGELHPVYRSPNFSMWAQFAWAACLALSGTYSKLLDYIVFTSLIFYIITMLGLLRLGRRIPEQVQMTRRRDYVVPVTYIVCASFIAFFLLFGDFFTPDAAARLESDFFGTKFFTSVAGLGLTALGLPIYFLWKKRKPVPGV